MPRGPIPKRSEDRRRRNKDAVTTRIPVAPAEVKPLPEDRSWSHTAKLWYRSLKASPQASLFQPTDWAEARLVAWLMSEEAKREDGPRASMMQAIFSRADNLLTTEGARRRLRLELAAAPVEQPKLAEVIEMDPVNLYGG